MEPRRKAYRTCTPQSFGIAAGRAAIAPGGRSLRLPPKAHNQSQHWISRSPPRGGLAFVLMLRCTSPLLARPGSASRRQKSPVLELSEKHLLDLKITGVDPKRPSAGSASPQRAVGSHPYLRLAKLVSRARASSSEVIQIWHIQVCGGPHATTGLHHTHQRRNSVAACSGTLNSKACPP